MNLIDLREFSYDKIISYKDDEFIFGNTVLENTFKRYFYKYDIENKNILKINDIGIETHEYATYDSCILNNYIYTNAYKVHGDDTETFIYRINLMNGRMEELYSIEKDVGVIILDERYALLRGNDFGIDKEHEDVQKDVKGDYDYAILCDLKDKKTYEIKDKRVILGIRDYFIPYIIDENRYIVFEEAYMEDWELEDTFEEGIKKEDFYREGYRESINIILLNEFALSVKNSSDKIPFKQIYKTELKAWTRYFGMDDENIYFRVKNFETKIQQIYSYNKRNSEKRLIKNIKMDNDYTHVNYNIWYNIENRKINEIKIIEDSIKQIKEIFDDDFVFQYSELREDYDGKIGNIIITSYWTEDDNGDNYKNYVKIRNTKNNTVDIYEGICVIVKDNLILFN